MSVRYQEFDRRQRLHTQVYKINNEMYKSIKNSQSTWTFFTKLSLNSWFQLQLMNIYLNHSYTVLMQINQMYLSLWRRLIKLSRYPCRHAAPNRPIVSSLFVLFFLPVERNRPENCCNPLDGNVYQKQLFELKNYCWAGS